MSEVTQLLKRWREGDKSAERALFDEVYPVIHALAREQMRRSFGHVTLRATELVNEAYERLERQRHVDWQNRAHFYSIAARMLRRVLIDYLRERDAQKRGAGAAHVELEDAIEIAVEDPVDRFDWMGLDQALTEFEAEEPKHAQLVELRYFAGLNIEQAAAALDVSTATAGRMWRFARAWLKRRMDGGAAAVSTTPVAG